MRDGNKKVRHLINERLMCLGFRSDYEGWKQFIKKHYINYLVTVLEVTMRDGNC